MQTLKECIFKTLIFFYIQVDSAIVELKHLSQLVTCQAVNIPHFAVSSRDDALSWHRFVLVRVYKLSHIS